MPDMPDMPRRVYDGLSGCCRGCRALSGSRGCRGVGVLSGLRRVFTSGCQAGAQQKKTRDTHENAICMRTETGIPSIRSCYTGASNTRPPAATLPITWSSKHNGEPVCEFLPRHQCKTSSAVLYCAVCCVLSLLPSPSRDIFWNVIFAKLSPLG